MHATRSAYTKTMPQLGRINDVAQCMQIHHARRLGHLLNDIFPMLSGAGPISSMVYGTLPTRGFGSIRGG